MSAIEREISGVLIDLKVDEGTRLDDLNEQDSYSYDLAWMFIGADNYRDLLRKYRDCVKRLRFAFKPVDGLPPGLLVEEDR